MDIKLHKAMHQGGQTNWICLSYALLETNIIREYLHHKQNLDFRTQKLKRIKQYITEFGGVMIDVWVDHEHAKLSKIDTTYFEILLSLELEHIRISTKKESWQNDPSYERWHFEVHPDMILHRYYELKLEMA